jgi:tyrosine-protein phosphatase YwqE
MSKDMALSRVMKSAANTGITMTKATPHTSKAAFASSASNVAGYLNWVT